MKPAITAIGTANPIYYRNQLDTAELISSALKLSPAEKRLMRAIYKAAGINKRHSVLADYHKNPGEFEFFPNDHTSPFPSTAERMKIYKASALPLALTAIENCLAQFNKKKITHVITVSCTGMYAPGLDIEIVQALQLNTQTQRTAINFMGCYGAFNGLKVANAICQSNPDAKVLMVCVELCTLHFQKNFDTTNIVSNAIFADGAAAVLVETPAAQQKHLRLQSFYCDLLPQTSQEMAWHIADSGFDIVLSSYVPEIIENGIAAFVKKIPHPADRHDYYAIHPGGLKILEACEAALGLTKTDNAFSYDILREFGNMSSATILFVLKRMWESLTADSHEKTIYSCAFGPGLTLESMLLQVHHGG